MKIKNLGIALRMAAVIMFLLMIVPRISSFTAGNIESGAALPLPVAIIAFFIIYAIKAVVVVIPVNVLYISAGMIFPPGLGILITYIGLAIALCVGYLTGKELGESKVKETLVKNKRAASFLNSQKNLASMCFLVRILPLPKDLFSMFFGAAGMPFGKFLLVSLIGLSPVMISSVIAGAYISR